MLSSCISSLPPLLFLTTINLFPLKISPFSISPFVLLEYFGPPRAERKNSGGKGYASWGYAKFLWSGMQLDRSRKHGGNAFAYPFEYPKLGYVCKFSCLQR